MVVVDLLAIRASSCVNAIGRLNRSQAAMQPTPGEVKDNRNLQKDED